MANPWFKCFPSRLLGALSGMTPTQGYVYVVALLRIYERGGPCPDSVAVFARRTGLRESVVSEALGFLFETGRLLKNDAGIHNPVALDVLSEQTEKADLLRSKAVKGAKARWEKTKRNQQNGHARGNAQAMPNDAESRRKKERESENPSSPSLDLESETPSSFGQLALTTGSVSSDEFETFWSAYPKKVAKIAAKRAFASARKRIKFGAMLSMLEVHKARWRDRGDAQYVPNPATWLNGNRWEDQLEGGSDGRAKTVVDAFDKILRRVEGCDGGALREDDLLRLPER